jgi:hypothetical protein
VFRIRIATVTEATIQSAFGDQFDHLPLEKLEYLLTINRPYLDYDSHSIGLNLMILENDFENIVKFLRQFEASTTIRSALLKAVYRVECSSIVTSSLAVMCHSLFA